MGLTQRTSSTERPRSGAPLLALALCVGLAPHAAAAPAAGVSPPFKTGAAPAQPTRSGGDTMVSTPWLRPRYAFPNSQLPARACRASLLKKFSGGHVSSLLQQIDRFNPAPSPARPSRPDAAGTRVVKRVCAGAVVRTSNTHHRRIGPLGVRRLDRGILLETTQPGSAARELQARPAVGLQPEGERRRILSVNGGILTAQVNGSCLGHREAPQVRL